MPDKDEVGGSSPPRPTPDLTSEYAGRCRRCHCTGRLPAEELLPDYRFESSGGRVRCQRSRTAARCLHTFNRYIRRSSRVMADPARGQRRDHGAHRRAGAGCRRSAQIPASRTVHDLVQLHLAGVQPARVGLWVGKRSPLRKFRGQLHSKDRGFTQLARLWRRGPGPPSSERHR
jgi:hypothetical protein